MSLAIYDYFSILHRHFWHIFATFLGYLIFWATFVPLLGIFRFGLNQFSQRFSAHYCLSNICTHILGISWLFLTNSNPILAQVSLMGCISRFFGHSSGPACVYSRILIIYQETRSCNFFSNVTILCIFPSTRWQLILVVIILIIHFLDLAYTTE